MTAVPVPVPRDEGDADVVSPFDLRVRLKIRALMVERGLTQAQLGERLGEGQGWISRRLCHPAAKGSYPVNLQELDRIARALNTTAAQLVASAQEVDASLLQYRPRRRRGASPTDATTLPTFQASNDCKTPANTPRVQVVGDFYSALSPGEPPLSLPVTDLATYRALRAGDTACASAAS